MSSSHCLGNGRNSRRERVSARRATVPMLTNGERERLSLFDAVNAQSYDKVLDLLQSGVDPRIPDKYGRTPLHVAATKTDAAIAKALIDHEADVNAEDSSGNTPLHLACVTGRLAIVGVLLRAGAQLSLSKSHSTPLTVALGRLHSLMNERRTISTPAIKTEVVELIRLLKQRASSSTENDSVSNLCQQFGTLQSSSLSPSSGNDSTSTLCQLFENLTSFSSQSSSLDDDSTLDSLISNLTISIYNNVHL